ncbi:MAG: flagellar filament capping protein FliD [Candidatus Marinimicrobia bacterium]|nr:flagellar filament capping protein FliD [Candidatus Neomarinimicrobiota bacterium]MCF7880545.1 flagellar filament capping protein FliD [Candidatus Neomarinimicrobiota bacterium]
MADGVASVSGLASGFDWANIVAQLMEIERTPIRRIERKQSEYEAKINLWQDINSQITNLRSSADTLRTADAFNKFNSSLSSSSSTDAEDLLSISTSEDASVGSYDITINQVALKQKISSQSFTEKDTALNLSGEILINGSVVSVNTTDTLQNIKNKINTANSGSTASDVTATILETADNDFRLVLTSDNSGRDGFDLLAADNTTLLQDMGLVDSTSSLRFQTSDGAKSNEFSNANTAVADVLGLSNAQSGSVTIGGQAISIDLASDSLVDIANAIDGAAGLSASVVTEENDAGDTVYRLDVSGSTSFTDSNNILQTLGFVENGFSSIAEIHASDTALQATSVAGGGAVTSATTFGEIDTGVDANDVTNGDTISISGTDHSGNTVSGTFTIADTSTDTIGDFLSEIESTFGGSGAVDAYISDGTDGFTAGTLVVEDQVSGDSQLSVDITSNNEGGGSLDFGTVSVDTEGRAMELQSGTDASLNVDGVTITRSDNTITDVIEGVTLDLLSADSGTSMDLSIGRDTEAITKEVNKFISNYNKVMGTISQQFSYSEEDGTGGMLFGDGTLRSVQSDVRNIIIQQVENVAEDFSTFGMVGINLDNEGQLSLDKTEFTAALQNNFNDVQRLFIGDGTSENSQLRYINHTRDTNAGVYEVNITQAATKAEVQGIANLSTGLTSQQTITLEEGTATAALTFDAGTDIDAIVAALNSEFDTAYQEAFTEATGHLNTSGSAITSSTTLNEIDTTGTATNDLSDGEKITFTGTARNGDTVSGSFEFTDITTQTVGDILSTIENAYNDNVTASVDSNGQIQIEDDSAGPSQLSISLAYDGSGSLAFDTLASTVTGRYRMDLEASKSSGGELDISHGSYGSNSFTVTADAEFGITDGVYTGQDVAGTINGEAATGDGQVLTGDEGESNVEDLTIEYTGTTTGAVGNLTLTYGISELMYQELYNVVDIYDGYVSQKIDSLQDSIKDFDADIEDKEGRLEIKRRELVRKFLSMESTISGLNAQSNWLQSQLNGLLTQYL